MNMRTILKHCIAALAACHLSVAALADESKIPEPFRGEMTTSPIQINYSDWTAILKQTVWETGRSDRSSAGPNRASIGTRISRGSNSPTRNEGNRLLFPAFASVEGNLETLRKIRKSLEAIPGEVPMKEWTKNEQLAYWLNLYNITIIEKLAEIYPVTSLKKHMKGSRKHPSLWDQKLLNVAGIPLSLNDIQHTILAEKWNTTLPMYGLFQGYVGGPNIRDHAYTGSEVRSMLIENAQEFVNSNRGMRVKGNTMEVSVYYKDNKKLFPNWNKDLKNHILHLTDLDYRSHVNRASKINAKTVDYHIADIFGGVRDHGTSAATNEAALYDTHIRVNEGVAADFNGISTMHFSDYADFSKAASQPRFPEHVMEYLRDYVKRRGNREGKVEVEEYEDVKPKEKSPK